MKKGILSVIVTLITINLILATPYGEHCIYDENLNPINYIEIIGWECIPTSDSTCILVDLSVPFTIDSMPIQSGTLSGFPNNFMRIEFTAAQQNNDYYIYYVNSDI